MGLSLSLIHEAFPSHALCWFLLNSEELSVHRRPWGPEGKTFFSLALRQATFYGVHWVCVCLPRSFFLVIPSPERTVQGPPRFVGLADSSGGRVH